MGARLVATTIEWLDEANPLRVWTADHEELKVSPHGGLLLRDWSGEERVLFSDRDLFMTPRHAAIAIRSEAAPTCVALLGEQGQLLVKVDLERASWVLEAEVPRVEDVTGGLTYLRPVVADELVIIFWELGVLALDAALQLRWRHDLEWNHVAIHLDEEQVWFDLMYESAEVPQRIGERPWGYALADGRELFDASPPADRRPPW
jgi:hypothetical protein